MLTPNTSQAEDVKDHGYAITLRIRTTKISRRAPDEYSVTIPAIPGSPCCPVRVWRAYIAFSHPAPDSPPFLSSNSTPLHARTATVALRIALGATGTSSLCYYMLHSLRRGAAQVAIGVGALLEDVYLVGNWCSAAVHSYVPNTAFTAVPQALSSFLG